MALHLHWNGRIGQGMNLDSGQAVQAPVAWAQLQELSKIQEGNDGMAEVETGRNSLLNQF